MLSGTAPILIVLAAMGLWTGGDGLWINMTSGKLTTFSIETVEQHGIGNNRYINITGGTWGDGLTYEYDEQTKVIDFVIYTLQSPETYTALADGKNTPIHVLVKKTANTPESNLENWIADSGGNEDEVEIQGVTMVGFDSIDSEFKGLIESMDMTVSESVVFLEEGAEPRSVGMNALMFVPSALFLGFMIVGLFSKDEEVIENDA